jgi:glutathione S-transferase
LLKVFTFGDSRSRRVLWALEEIGLAYERVELPAWPPRSQADYLAVNPAGTVPAIEDGDIRLTESLVICEYLGRTYGGGLVVGPEEPGTLRYQELVSFGESTLMPPLTWARRFGRMSEAALAECRGAFAARLATVEQALADGRQFLVADRLTVADLSVGFVLRLSRLYGLASLIPPVTAQYAARLEARPAFRRAYGLD